MTASIDKMLAWVEAMKASIDAASYEELLARWRSAPVGSPWFVGELGRYYQQRMREKRNQDPAEAVAASKRIG